MRWSSADDLKHEIHFQDIQVGEIGKKSPPGGLAASEAELLRQKPAGGLRRAGELGRQRLDSCLLGLGLSAIQRVGEDLVERSSICHGVTLYATPRGGDPRRRS